MLTHVDLFSGPGGICTGLKAAGIKTIMAVEKVKSCVDTYSANHPEVKIIHKDIRDVSNEDLRYLKNSKIDIITSGMPCETFSTAGSKSRSSYDHRQQLYSEAIRIASILRPKLILFENVVGIMSKKTEKNGKRLIIEDIFDELSSIGYKYYIQTTLLASDFGIPQKRCRYFILATHDPNIKLSQPISKHNGTVTVNMAFEDLPKVEANQEVTKLNYRRKSNYYIDLMKDNAFWRHQTNNVSLTYHVPPKHRHGTIERFKLINQGENLKDIFQKFDENKLKELQANKILPKKWYIQRNMRLLPNEPSKTVTSHCLDELVHPVLNRALTVREVARLQSFPDYYDFSGGPFICPHMYETQDKYEQIGDAVPPLLAYHWGKTFIDILK